MNTQITLLSDDTLDAVSAGMMKQPIYDPTKAPGAYVSSGGAGNWQAEQAAAWVGIFGTIGAVTSAASLVL
jgi:hypothetical protein